MRTFPNTNKYTNAPFCQDFSAGRLCSTNTKVLGEKKYSCYPQILGVLLFKFLKSTQYILFFFFFFCFQLLVVHGLVLRPEGMCSGLVVIKTRQNLWISADTGR